MVTRQGGATREDLRAAVFSGIMPSVTSGGDRLEPLPTSPVAPIAIEATRRLIPHDRAAVVLTVLTVLVVALIAKLPEAVLPIASDTGMFATYAKMLLHGARPYVDFYDIHPPVALYYWVLVEWLAGFDWARTCVGSWGTFAPQPCISIVAHGLDLALTLVTAGFSYAITRCLGLRPLVGVFAAVLVVWFANESMISMEGSTPTKLTLVPGTLAVYAYLRALPKGRLGWAVISGAAAMLAVLTKQPALMTLFAIVAVLIPGALRGGSGERRLMFSFVVGTLLTLAPVVAYMAWIGSLYGFLDQPWLYNLQRFVVGYWQSPSGLSTPATRLDGVLSQSAGVLFVGALVGALALWLDPSAGRQRVLLVWGLFSVVAIAGFREYAQVVPPLALLAAVAMGRLWAAAARNGLGLGRPIAGRVGLVLIFGSIFVLSSSFQLTQVRRAIYERGPSGKPTDPDVVASYLRQMTPPGPIFAWANAGQVYALSGRDPASRFLIAEFTDSIQPRARESRQQLITDLQQHPASAIVVDPHGDEPGVEISAFPELEALLRACYARVPGMPAGWTVFQRTSVSCSA